MTPPAKPTIKPANPRFSCGPCSKYPGWDFSHLHNAALGRSHRAATAKNKLKEVIDRSRKLLGVPDDFLVAIVPASDTGAVEMAMWSMLGARGLTVLAWENFSNDWAIDAAEQLKLPNTRIMTADYGKLPDLTSVDFDTDVVFAWNGTTSGARVPNGDWIPANRAGITICDATSAAFSMELPWDKLDVTTYSWQKVLGGEAQHGMLILSPRAVERLESYTPSWPLPKLFRMTSKGKINKALFEGETINTVSMLAVEDVLASMAWAESIGGRPALIERTNKNAAILWQWIEQSDWADFLTKDKTIRSTTSVCISIKDPWFTNQSKDAQAEISKKIVSLLDKEGAGYDVASYRTAPSGLRIWCGATVESSDLAALLPWLDWAYATVKAGV